MRKLLFLVAEDSYFCSHRLNLAIAAHHAGFKVAVATRCHHHIKKIQDANIQIYPLKYFNRGNLTPLKQLYSLHELYKIYRDFNPTVVHHVAMKPVIMGSLMAGWCNIPKVINALGGLGYLFTEQSSNPSTSKHSSFYKKTLKLILRKTICHLLHWIFSKPNTLLILQNKDDIETLMKHRCISLNKTILIQGSGVDTNVFLVTPMPSEPPIIITCISRMLWDKGIGELVEAAKILKKEEIPAQIILYGMPDPENPASIDVKQLQSWHDSNIITWKGNCEDVAKAYSECHIAVLPSYREGLPKSLLEAASCGRPIVTTDVPGCREVVEQNVNGYLVPPKDPKSLAEALKKLGKDEHERIKMGKNGRSKIESSFSDKIILDKIIQLYN